MSCIQEILKIKGENDFLKIPGDRFLGVEHGGHYKGYDYLITFTGNAVRCGYVALFPDHPLSKVAHYDDLPIECHSGVTFFCQHSLVKKILGDHVCGDEWIGFDAGHSGDGYDIDHYKKYFGEPQKEIMDHFIRMSNIRCSWEGNPTIKTKEYVENPMQAYN